MKKIMLLVMLTIASISNIHAQSGDCGCTPTSTQHVITKILCPSYDIVDENGNVWTVTDPEWIRITYTEVDCGGKSSIRIDEITQSTMQYQIELNGWHIVSGTGCTDPVTHLQAGFITPGAYFTYPFTHGDELDALYKRVIAEMIPMPNGNYNPNSIYFVGGCASYARIQWPSNTRFWVPANDVQTTGHYVNVSNTVVRIPCGPACCEVQLITAYGGAYTYQSLNGQCDPNAIPDPNFVPTFIGNDQYGNPVTYYGSILSNGGCHPICNDGPPQITMRPAGIKAINKDVEIKLSANPTLVKDWVTFTTNKPITNVEIYSMDGKKVINKAPENNELNLSSLPIGVYVMRVYFETNALKTIKIEKQ
jgi:hypothetical protein